MTDIQEQIKKAEERLAKLREKAAAPPKQRKQRSEKQLQELMLLEIELKKRYGAGFAGLANAVTRARKDGVVVPQGQAIVDAAVTDEPEGEVSITLTPHVEEGVDAGGEHEPVPAGEEAPW